MEDLTTRTDFTTQESEPHHSELTDAFDVGVDAAMAGKAATSCPYPTGQKRKRWLFGFFTAKAEVPIHRIAVAYKPR